MSVEYQLKFKFSDHNELDQTVRSARNFDSYDEKYKLYNFRTQENKDTANMPDAHVSLADEGIIFCDNCRNTAAPIFQHLITRIIGKFGKVEIDEL